MNTQFCRIPPPHPPYLLCYTPLSSTIPFVLPTIPPLAFWSQLQGPWRLSLSWKWQLKGTPIRVGFFFSSSHNLFSVKQKSYSDFKRKKGTTSVLACKYGGKWFDTSLTISSHSAGIIMTGHWQSIVLPLWAALCWNYFCPLSISCDS